MLSEKAQKQLARFFKTVKEENGFEPTSIDFYRHRADQATADLLENEFLYEKHESTDGGYHWVKRTGEAAGVKINFTVFYDREETEETCYNCPEPVGNSEDPEKKLCQECYDKQMQEWEDEQRGLERDYYRDIL